MSDDLAEITGVVIDPSGLKRMEIGERDPRLSEAVAIARYFGARLEEMVSPPEDRRLVDQLQNLVNDIQAGRKRIADIGSAFQSAHVAYQRSRMELDRVLRSEEIREAVEKSGRSELSALYARLQNMEIGQ